LFYADYSKKEREINFENTFSSGNGSADKQGNARLLLKKLRTPSRREIVVPTRRATKAATKWVDLFHARQVSLASPSSSWV
jgi:hypothetical protein